MKNNVKRINVNDILRKTDRLLNFYENQNIYIELSKIESIDEFCEYVSKFNYDSNFINGIIEIDSRIKIDDWADKFIKKYHIYLKGKLDIDCREYYNNEYCWNLYLEQCLKTSDDDFEKAVFFNGKKLKKIDSILNTVYLQLINRLNRNSDLSYKDKKFLEQSFLCYAYYNRIYKDSPFEMMRSIVLYFKKYPISDFNKPRNNQLFLINKISEELLKADNNCAFEFSMEMNDDNLGNFYHTEEGIPVLEINAADIYDVDSDYTFVRKNFTIFHEIAHFIQDVNPESYNSVMQEIIKIEKQLILFDREFYENNHDDFFIERDADLYAMKRIKEDFGKIYPEEVLSILKSRDVFKRKDISEFYKMEVKRYNLIHCDDNKNNSSSKKKSIKR